MDSSSVASQNVITETLKKLEEIVDILHRHVDSSKISNSETIQSDELKRNAEIEYIFTQSNGHVNNFITRCGQRSIDTKQAISTLYAMAESIGNIQDKMMKKEKIKQLDDGIKHARIVKIANEFDSDTKTYAKLKQECERWEILPREIADYFTPSKRDLSDRESNPSLFDRLLKLQRLVLEEKDNK